MSTGDELAALILLLLGLAAFVNVARGTFWAWLHAKFIGAPPTTPSPYRKAPA